MAKYEIVGGVGIIPKGVTAIGDYAFFDCTSLTSVEIPSSVTEIGNSAFEGCSSLTSIVVEEGNSVYDSREGCNAIIETATNKLIRGCNSTIIPSSVTEIGRSAFYGCTSLASIEIPSSVTKIEYGAFDGCTSLTSIVVKEGNSVFDSREGCNAIIETATNTLIKGCNSTIIPSNVTKIGESAFQDCTSLTSIEIPSSVTKIEYGAFDGCTSLTSVVIPEGVTKIGERTFEGCTSLTSIAIPSSVTAIGFRTFSYCSSLTSIVIPEGVTEIGGGAFADCTSLTSVVIPSSVTEIGKNAFPGCASLTSIIVEEGNSVYDSREGCNAIIETVTNTLIAACKSTIIPLGVTEIPCKAFNDTSLTSIEIPSSVKMIGWDAFINCTSLTSVAINGKIKKIDRGTFRGCTALESITLPPGVNKIEWDAFEGCTSIKVINVPAKKYDYYYERIPSPFNSLIVEMEPVKKAKKKK